MPDDDEIIVAALLHDIGHIIGLKQGLEQMGDVGVMNHEDIGADFATKKLGLPERIGKLIKAHVNAKRFLCWQNPEYHNKLSDASKTTLTYQGGVMKKKEAILGLQVIQRFF